LAQVAVTKSRPPHGQHAGSALVSSGWGKHDAPDFARPIARDGFTGPPGIGGPDFWRRTLRVCAAECGASDVDPVWLNSKVQAEQRNAAARRIETAIDAITSEVTAHNVTAIDAVPMLL
jgi:hypothetical protein